MQQIYGVVRVVTAEQVDQPPSPALRQWNVGVDQKGGEPLAGIWEKSFLNGPKIENGVYRRRYNHEFDKAFNSTNALNVTKTSRLRYAGHMIRRPKDLPKRALFKAKPNGRRNKERPKSRWVDGANSDSLALGFREWMGNSKATAAARRRDTFDQQVFGKCSTGKHNNKEKRLERIMAVGIRNHRDPITTWF
jgi:hypothetical protein